VEFSFLVVAVVVVVVVVVVVIVAVVLVVLVLVVVVLIVVLVVVVVLLIVAVVVVSVALQRICWALADFQFLKPVYCRKGKDYGRGSNLTQKATYTSTQIQNKHTDIHASSRTRTHDPSV
jgi:hypothetical protein